MKTMQRVLAAVAVLFGIATLVAGGRVLAGADPGYAVYRPLLVYNTFMGLAYLVAGLLAWTHVLRGRNAAAAIFALNLLVLAFVGYRYLGPGGIAVQSVGAMTLRTVVWLALLVAWQWLALRERRDRPQGA